MQRDRCERVDEEGSLTRRWSSVRLRFVAGSLFFVFSAQYVHKGGLWRRFDGEVSNATKYVHLDVFSLPGLPEERVAALVAKCPRGHKNRRGSQTLRG